MPISFDVELRLASKTYPCGNLWSETHIEGGSTRLSHGPSEFTAQVDSPDPQIKEAEVILTPNPKAVESRASIDRIWGKEIVFSHIPLTRQDLSR